jgi:uncharacterized protein
MGQIYIQFHGKLNDFLPAERKNHTIRVDFSDKTALKHIVESLGIPHPEVGNVLVNSIPGELSYHIQNLDDIYIYPLELNPDSPNQTAPAFVLDNHLGKLTGYLRLLGFDAIYNSTWDDAELAQFASQQNRALLTRDRGLLKRKIITSGYCLRSELPQDQLEEVLDHFNLDKKIKPFSRCSRCNGKLEPVDKSVIFEHLQPLTRLYYEEFTICISCRQIYWKGSHYDKIEKFISRFANHSPGIE